MAMQPSVSVLIPAFNAGKFLKIAVTSILKQTFVDFELIVIDDGSTDDSFDGLPDINDPRVRIVRNSSNLGIVASRNIAIKLARAPLIACLDADDVAMPRRLELQVEKFRLSPDLVLLGSAAVLIDAQGKPFDAVDVPTTDQEIRREILWGNKFVQSSVMMRKSVVTALGGYPEDAALAEDYALWLRIIASHAVGNLPERLVQYRVHKQQVSQTKMQQMRHMIIMLQFQAWTALQREGHAEGVLPPLTQTRWSKLRGGVGSYGRDCVYWARTYRRMGSWTDTIRFFAAGLVSAPLCTALYTTLLPPNLFTKWHWHRDQEA